jgi:hypothetical protein
LAWAGIVNANWLKRGLVIEKSRNNFKLNRIAALMTFKFHPDIIALARWVYSNCSVKIYTEHELCYKASERVSLGLLRKDSDEFRRLTAIDSIIEKYIDRMLLSRRRSR